MVGDFVKGDCRNRGLFFLELQLFLNQPNVSLGSDSILVPQWPFPSDLGAKCRWHIVILIFHDLRSR